MLLCKWLTQLFKLTFPNFTYSICPLLMSSVVTLWCKNTKCSFMLHHTIPNHTQGSVQSLIPQPLVRDNMTMGGCLSHPKQTLVSKSNFSRLLKFPFITIWKRMCIHETQCLEFTISPTSTSIPPTIIFTKTSKYLRDDHVCVLSLQVSESPHILSRHCANITKAIQFNSIPPQPMGPTQKCWKSLQGRWHKWCGSVALHPMPTNLQLAVLLINHSATNSVGSPPSSTWQPLYRPWHHPIPQNDQLFPSGQSMGWPYKSICHGTPWPFSPNIPYLLIQIFFAQNLCR